MPANVTLDAGLECWTVLRLGYYPVELLRYELRSSNDYPDKPPELSVDYNPYDTCDIIKADRAGNPNPWDSASNPEESQRFDCYSSVKVSYDDGACGQYLHQAPSYNEAFSEAYYAQYHYLNCTEEQASTTSACPYTKTLIGNCTSQAFKCDYMPDDSNSCNKPAYKLVVRFSAALILATCLAAKAAFMVAVNFRARSRVKSQCLTFGDVLVASVLEDIRIPNECLVNGGDFHRRKTSHKCHKHCKAWAEPSDTGDDIGHCQKCSKFNAVDNLPNLPWPALAMKRKKSLLSNLGQTALTQMLVLSLCSTAMLVASVMLSVMYVSHYSTAVCAGWTTYNHQFTTPQVITVMQASSMWAEVAAFCISNGAQLIYSTLYLLLLYNLTLISMEYDWGKFEKGRRRLRCAIVKGPEFEQSYLLQLPKRVMFPIIGYSILMHWLLGLAIYTEETIVADAFERYPVYSVSARSPRSRRALPTPSASPSVFRRADNADRHRPSVRMGLKRPAPPDDDWLLVGLYL